MLARQCQPVCLVRHFYCPSDPFGLACFGRQGTEVLDSLHVLFSSLSAENTIWLDTLVLCAVAVLAKLCFVVRLAGRCAKGPAVTKA